MNDLYKVFTCMYLHKHVNFENYEVSNDCYFILQTPRYMITELNRYAHVPYGVKHVVLNLLSDYYILDNIIPETVQIMTLHNKLKSFTNMPKSITEIRFEYDFDVELLPNQIPEHIKIINFGLYYNKKLDIDVLPKSLETLIIGASYNQIIKKGVLPNNLTKLYIHSYHSNIFEYDAIPDSVRFIYILNISIINNIRLPKNLVELNVSTKLPIEIDTFKYNYSYSIYSDIPDEASEICDEVYEVLGEKFYTNSDFIEKMHENVINQINTPQTYFGRIIQEEMYRIVFDTTRIIGIIKYIKERDNININMIDIIKNY